MDLGQADQHQQDVEPFPGRQGAQTAVFLAELLLETDLSMLASEAGPGSSSPNMGYLT